VRTLLLTGFAPFAGDEVNPSAELARYFHRQNFAPGWEVHGLVLPVNAARAWAMVQRAIRRYEPSAIMALGLSGRGEITPEALARNAIDYPMPDNDGVMCRAMHGVRRLARDAKLRSPAPVAAVVSAMQATGAAVRLSEDAGSFVCNHLYLRLLYRTRLPSHPAHGRSLFVHVPRLPEMGGVSQPWTVQCRALAAGMGALCS
jgi:pyroglutamyl-peptidase